ncbi:anhydro-N-acetylmuramic acid kinase [Agaricicola taiwanensis]|uniref:Anhydro-N-acetylmuramic acid kinase n=1 Tax=Agaricicola taiwanensis TaxID=591372 RepID=A0A8J2YHV2_9RHOB|nr:anhydro-N-acetylmuramic acid kinase [Agaricicola taiwanensis]GGE43849.1 anhydro-N-acetylmuramic acid kinase [Agaricicola taiwanensis]
MRALGLMSGTSLDGVDIAVLETDGDTIEAFGPTGYRPYSQIERAMLQDALAEAISLTDRTARPGVLACAETMITAAHAEAVEAFLKGHGLMPRDIDVVGFHGQTVLHRPQARLTVQIGDGHALASRLGITVVGDLRAADVAAGGQGAPLVPAYHQALVQRLGLAGPIAVLNLGGVANVTLVDDGAAPRAFDLGPANALLDDFMKERTGEGFDRDGFTAAAGEVDEEALARLLRHPFFDQPPPKSLDRNDFRAWTDEQGGLSEVTLETGAATLTALTAAGVAVSRRFMSSAPRLWVVAGGGTRNPTLMAMLSERLAPAEVTAADALGFPADYVEAQAFAYLAVRALRGLPLTYPSTTGVPSPLTGGVIFKADTLVRI